MKHLLRFSIIFLSLMMVSCGEDEPDYTNCGWLSIDNGLIDPFYQVGNNGNPQSIINLGSNSVGDIVKKCNWIHLYKDDDEVEVEREDGSTIVISLSNEEYEYGKL